MLCPPDTTLVGAGFYQRKCTYCGRGVWVDAEAIERVEAGIVLPLCAACVSLELDVHSGVRIGVMPGQEEVLSAQFGIAARTGESEVLDHGSTRHRRLLDAIDEIQRHHRNAPRPSAGPTDKGEET